jgi:pimeloyl-ACP methyl ester carboxylesterase
MSDLLQRADPARDATPNMERIRAKVDERIGITGPSPKARPSFRRSWVVAVASFAVVLVVALPFLLPNESSVYEPSLDGIAEMPGIDSVTPLASGGLQATAVDGDSIWVMTTLQNLLQQVSVSGDILATYPVDARVEGLVVGEDHIWLLTPDDGGAALRFDPGAGVVDLTVPLGGSPGWAHWFGDALWVSNEEGQLLQISPAGELISTRPGELKGGEGLGYLWVNDPETNLISSLSEDGTLGEIVVPTTGAEPGTMTGAGVRQVAEAAGKLYLMDGDYPFGTNLSVFDPDTGEVEPFVSLTFGLLDLAEFDGYLWVTSHTDFLLIRIDPVSGEVVRYPMPGKAAGIQVADGSLWVSLYHPGALVRVDPTALLQSAEITADDWNRYPHRLLCTGNSAPGEPTVLLEPYDWLDYGSWSVIQARLSNEGYRVCANGYIEGEDTPQHRAADLDEALTEAGIGGPFVLVAAGEGVHATRLFADGRDDVAGVVLVDPSPVGFQQVVDELLPGAAGAPPWTDIESNVSNSLDDFGDLPLTVIARDPESVFLSDNFVTTYGEETATALNDAWQEGLDFYSGLSTDSQTVVADGTGMHMVIWDQPDLVVEEILGVIGSD